MSHGNHTYLTFLLNTAIDTLPTAANLKRWKKSGSDNCTLCKGRETTKHSLNICKVALESGRFTWRHNNLIHYVVSNIDTSRFSFFSDLPGFSAPGGGTVPVQLCVTTFKPDIVIIDNTDKTVHIWELMSFMKTT